MDDKRSSYPINTEMVWITIMTPDGKKRKIKVRSPRHTHNAKPNTTNFVVRFTDNEGVEHNLAEFIINFPIQNMCGEIEESFTAALELISRMITMMYIVGR